MKMTREHFQNGVCKRKGENLEINQSRVNVLSLQKKITHGLLEKKLHTKKTGRTKEALQNHPLRKPKKSKKYTYIA